ncbi:uncharacterized protein K452DRAFT_331025 [Aplosporella prunicola CBS 121167]|uniref:Uncharacterized protein n=1 Tax=Aplosporella prunicola CBS 121167 TaxID=1176127 RepID=A0A6A6BVZ4_9PEZI|nr:uncharacterized protein K452DRAFT_331025 [Aplosporella prunicola CBS 121167]KAF2147455.1 hypothetical protein K452DRAFT_331025 [Aplosporella prunicola CBS 121167]
MPSMSTVIYGGPEAQLDAFLELMFMGHKEASMTRVSYVVLSGLRLPPKLLTRIRELETPRAINSNVIQAEVAELVSRHGYRESDYFPHFFITKTGYMGVGPKHMREGDIVAILLGGRVPYLLRPRGGRFVLIGECMVAGVMSGEVIDEFDAGKRTLREFALD